MSSSSWSVNPSFSLPPDIGFSLDDVAMFVPPMAISVRILLFVVVVVLYPLLRHLIPFLVLCVSGLLTNLIQMVCFICVWPISEVAYTRINSAVKKFDWFVLVCLIDRFAGVKVSVYTDQATIRLMSEGHVLFISNDRADADHLYDLVLAQWSGCLGTLLTVIKTSAKFIRSKILHRNDIPQPFWISLFLERTGLEHGEFVAAQKLPSSVSSDHCKDMVYAVRHMRSVVPAIYDIHVAIRKALPSPTLKSLFKEGPSVAHVYIKRLLTNELPKTHDVSEKCTESLAVKDSLMDKYKVEHSFCEQRSQVIGWPVMSFMVILFTFLLELGDLNFVNCSTLLVFSAALFAGRTLAIFGCGVLSLLRANIDWSCLLYNIALFVVDIVGLIIDSGRYDIYYSW